MKIQMDLPIRDLGNFDTFFVLFWGGVSWG
jgi:hypothetical protein